MTTNISPSVDGASIDVFSTDSRGGGDASNLTTIDLVVGVNIAGQIHDQMRGRAPGTPVTSVTITDEAPAKRRALRRRRG